ncbi:MAG: response regulator transcription factor [Planctomycetota bacterium]
MENEKQTQRILLVEDDTALAAMVSEFLNANEFSATVETRGDVAVNRSVEENPEAVVLDVGLPGLNGFDVCQAVRTKYSGVILMLTARGEEVDEVLGLEAGADDYMAKPVRPRVLLARLRTHLRRLTPAEAASTPITVGSMVVDPSRRSVEIGGEAVDVTTAEFDLLKLLAENVGHTLSRNDIYQQIHGTKYDGLDRSIDLRISRLRKKLGDDPAKPQRIKSVRGVGYMLAVEL